MQRQRGLTLLELLVVLAIIGFAMAGVSLSLRDNRQTQLEREAQRLVAMLEAARAQSRTSGVSLIWQATSEGFVIQPAQVPTNILQPNQLQTGNAQNTLTAHSESWLTAGTQAVVSTTTANNTVPANFVTLGPEPILTPTRITLSVVASNANAQTVPSLTVGTDGLRPFQVVP